MLNEPCPQSKPSAVSQSIGLAGWHCRLTVDAPGYEQEVSRLFGTHPLSGPDKAQSEIILTKHEGTWEIRWRHCGQPGDLTLLLLSLEGKRFVSMPDHQGQTYRDTVLGDAAALAVADGALRVLQSERWPLYLEFVLTWLMMREGNIVTLHAAVCAAQETALVLMGASGAGKSTLSAALSAQGADYYGDENVFFQRTQRCLFVRPKSLGLRPGGLDLLPELSEGRWSEAKPNDPKYTVALPAPSRPCPQEKARFYFLDGFASAPALARMPSSEMTRRLLRGMGHGDPSLDARLDTAAEIAGRFPGWRLTLGPPEETAKLLIAHLSDAP